MRPYEITTDQDDIVVRLPRQVADEEVLAKLLDYLALEAIRRQSALTREDAASLTKEVKQGGWQQVEHLFEKE
jgi:hypothetical protein